MSRYPNKAAKSRATVVYHVGERPIVGGRVSHGFSQEGGELSVSRHPEEWQQIARLGGEIWQLKKVGARFFQVTGNCSAVAITWAVRHGYIEPTVVWRVWCGYDAESEDETHFTFFSREEAEKEAALCDPEDREGGNHQNGEVEEVAGYRFGPLGEAYWLKNFDGLVKHEWAEAFAPIFYARAHGYDGVWYNERYDPDNLSCPRGLILQEKLPEWTVVRS